MNNRSSSYSSEDKNFSLSLILVITIFTAAAMLYYWNNNNTLYIKYLTVKEYIIGLNNQEMKEYITELYSHNSLEKAAKLIEGLIDKSQEINEEDKHLLAEIYFKNANYQKALPLYEKLYNTSEEPEGFMFFYAACLYHLEQYNKALPLFYQYFSMDDMLFDNVEYILKTLLQQKKKHEGLSFIESYIEKYPDIQKYFVTYINRLKKLPDLKNSKSIRIAGLNNHFHIPIKIGLSDKGYKYIVDTGASLMTINPQIFKANEGVIRKTGTKVSVVNADNKVSTLDIVVIEWLKVGDIELKNVKAVLKPKGENLLGQNVLKQFQIKTKKENGITFLELVK